MSRNDPLTRRGMRRVFVFTLIFILAASTAGAEEADTLYLVDGTSVSGKILFHHDGVYTVSTGSGTQRLPASRVARIQFASKMASAA